MREKFLLDMQRFIVSLLLYTHYVQSMEFLKRQSYRRGYMELVHKDKIHGRKAFNGKKVTHRFECMQWCLQTDTCKSINWNEATLDCQLLKFDRHNAPFYIDKVKLFSFVLSAPTDHPRLMDRSDPICRNWYTLEFCTVYIMIC